MRMASTSLRAWNAVRSEEDALINVEQTLARV
jgi:hypothetical protein